MRNYLYNSSPARPSPHIRDLAKNTQEVKIVVLVLKLLASNKCNRRYFRIPGRGTEILRCFEECTILYIVDNPPREINKTMTSEQKEFKTKSGRSHQF